MTLDHLHQLRLWHMRHAGRAPLEGRAWTAVLTAWLIGWVGAPEALLLGSDAAALGLLALVFLPGLYVALRRRLHRRGRLRCDWIAAIE
jgi:hypothetical protein